MEKQTLYTEQVKTQGMTYFLDLKSSEKAGPYLVMTQSQKNKEGNFQHNRIWLFSSNLDDFMVAFERAVEQFRTHIPQKQK